VIILNLISKKDLLAITGISYGQLYRWKRERLIPDEWFIKQSSYTGQETFFPREQILSRVKSILELKDKYSLEELSRILSPDAAVTIISLNDLKNINEIEGSLFTILPKVSEKESYDFFDIAFLIALSQTIKKTDLSDEQCGDLIRKSIMAVSKQKSTNLSCIFFFAGNEYHTVFTINAAFVFDDSIEVINQVSLSEIVDKIKVKYKYQFVQN
jgi:hypothetical protein